MADRQAEPGLPVLRLARRRHRCTVEPAIVGWPLRARGRLGGSAAGRGRVRRVAPRLPTVATAQVRQDGIAGAIDEHVCLYRDTAVFADDGYRTSQ